jgi:Uma2 family endonuclease
MSTETRPKRLHRPGGPEEGRFQRRAEPPEPLRGPPHVNYPDCDGRLMSDNTLQDHWIGLIKGGLGQVFRDDPNVFIAANLMWYPVKGNNRRRLSPDVMVAFGRPKGYRGSYMQHKERGIPPTVVFEIRSPGNRKRVMDYKQKIYEMYGIEEYYVFDPYKIGLEVWLGEGNVFRSIPEPSGWVSPRLGIRFELAEDLTIYGPDGQPFLDYVEVAHQRDEEKLRADEEKLRADEEKLRADEEKLRADEEKLRADEEKLRADEEKLRADEEKLRAEVERQLRLESDRRAEQLRARLRAAGLDPDE